MAQDTDPWATLKAENAALRAEVEQLKGRAETQAIDFREAQLDMYRKGLEKIAGLKGHQSLLGAEYCNECAVCEATRILREFPLTDAMVAKLKAAPGKGPTKPVPEDADL